MVELSKIQCRFLLKKNGADVYMKADLNNQYYYNREILLQVSKIWV